MVKTLGCSLEVSLFAKSDPSPSTNFAWADQTEASASVHGVARQDELRSGSRYERDVQHDSYARHSVSAPAARGGTPTGNAVPPECWLADEEEQHVSKVAQASGNL